ncbi:CobW family GTP-binding protein [Marinivivus vitaminiproducens]|uniref:CobW family GTP-binding protein n=1 Tax=Marinivivus vitaminiproducens TaxID=3035935 RepID=UPI00279F4FB1|nr:GTP-binding protein [Geminicoccaceae bacterium SCSIO 64248]
MAPARLPISLLTGFLGSGKTTLLNALIRHPEAGTLAVIINEFGEIGLDHDLVAKTDDETVLLSGGCLCCTVKGELIETLARLYARRAKGEVPPFDRVLIETTGLADPTPILQALILDPTVAAQFVLDGVITTIDAVNGLATLDGHELAVKQAAVADRLLLTKTDLADAERLSKLHARLGIINPGTDPVHVVQGEIAPGHLFGVGIYDPASKHPDVQTWLNAEAYGPEAQRRGRHDAHGHDHDHEHHHHGHDHGHHDHSHDVNRHDDHIKAFCITYDKPIRLDALAGWLDTMLMLRGRDMLRIKAILNLEGEDKPAVLHGVQEIFHPLVSLDAWPDEDRRSRIVFITRDMDPSFLEATLKEFNEGTPADAPAPA